MQPSGVLPRLPESGEFSSDVLVGFLRVKVIPHELVPRRLCRKGVVLGRGVGVGGGRVLLWPAVFSALAASTFVGGGSSFLGVPDIPRPANAAGWAAQWHGVRSIFRSRRLWWMAPLGSVVIGSFMALMLWLYYASAAFFFGAEIVRVRTINYLAGNK